MWHGNALIVPNFGAASWVADGAACTFTNSSQKDLEFALRKLLTNPELRLKLSSQGLHRAMEFDVKNIGLQLERVLDEVVRIG